MNKKQREWAAEQERLRRAAFAGALSEKFAAIEKRESRAAQYEGLDALQEDIKREIERAAQWDRESIYQSNEGKKNWALGGVIASSAAYPVIVGLSMFEPVTASVLYTLTAMGITVGGVRSMVKGAERMYEENKEKNALWLEKLNVYSRLAEQVKADIVNNHILEMSNDPKAPVLLEKFPDIGVAFAKATINASQQPKTVHLPKPGPKSGR